MVTSCFRLAGGDQSEGGQVAFMVQQEVELDRALGPPELGPGKKREAKGDRGAVQAEQLVFEPEFMSARSSLTADGQGLVKQVPEHLPGPMSVGVGQGGLVGGVFHAQMFQLSQAAGQATTDFAQGFWLEPAGKTTWPQSDPRNYNRLAVPLRLGENEPRSANWWRLNKEIS